MPQRHPARSPLCAALLAAFAATALPAAAQTTPAEPAVTTLDVVKVTARKREESLQDVPVAVTALSAEQLDRLAIKDLGDLQGQVPNLTIYAARGSNTTLTTFIRGVGQADPLWGVDPGVGIYFDDVYIARPQGALLDVYDVQRVEVLRGPQGTLYGKNTVGGAVKYVSKPLPTQTEGQVTLAVGNYGQVQAKGAVGTAVNDGQFRVRLAAASLAGMAVAAAAGVVFERVLVRPVYGQHLKQILITMGGMIIGEELIKASWGPALIPLPLPDTLRGIFLLGDVAVEKFRVLAMLVGLVVLVGLLLVLNRTKIGLLIRAGVQDREMVEALGYRIRRLFVGVFVAGAALAGLGGVLWGLVQQGVEPQIGARVNLLLFIVIIIGGLGSTVGCLVGALLVGLVANYAGFLAPKAALFSNIGLMVAILLWRPQGLYPVGAK